MRTLRLGNAMSEAMREELARDERVFYMGVDVSTGLSGIGNKKLIGEFGPQRIRDTPISELGVLGAGVGAAAVGMVPVVNLSMANFLYVAFDQLANQAGKLRYMTAGGASFPLTIVATMGVCGSAAQHSDLPVAQVINCGGIKVVCPSNPADAKGLLKAAIRDPNPVLFLPHMSMMGVRGEVPDGEYVTPLSSARVAREGSDVTVVAWSLMAQKALAAADELDGDISVELIDPRTLHPLDLDTIVASVEKTGRLVVVDEARQSCSAARDIVAQVCSEAFGALKAPPRVLANPDVHVPFSPELEQAVIPQPHDIVDAVRSICSQEVSA